MRQRIKKTRVSIKKKLAVFAINHCLVSSYFDSFCLYDFTAQSEDSIFWHVLSELCKDATVSLRKLAMCSNNHFAFYCCQ